MDGEPLPGLTLFTTFLCLGFSLWFAIYLLSRSRNNYLAFRAAIALVALAFYFNSVLNDILYSTTTNGLVRSFGILIALLATHDLTFALLPPPQHARLYPLARAIILLGMMVLLFNLTVPQPPACDTQLICPARLAFPWLVVDLFKIFVFASMIYNLWLVRQTEGLLRNASFNLAIVVGLGSVAYGLAGTLLSLELSRVPANLMILSSLLLLAYSVTRDGTFVSGSMSRYDLPVTLLTIAAIVVVYILAGRQLNLFGAETLLIAVLAIFTHSAYDFVREFLDRLVNKQERRLKQELLALGREVAEGDSLKHYLNRGLAILCYNLRASCGFIALREDDHYSVVASLHSLPAGAPFPSKQLTLEGVTDASGSLIPSIAWLAPAFAGRDQIAVIGLGTRKNKVPYTEEDLFWLEDIAQEIGEVIHLNMLKRARPAPESQSTAANPNQEPARSIDPGSLLSAVAYQPDSELVKCVEDGYRHLHDYHELGESPLVSLFGIQGDDHIECGKQVHNRLIEILEKLRPAGQPPRTPMPSEWFAYTILHELYVEESLTREIMAKLYIGEGTFYRLRRQALRGLARAMLETGAIR